ncbi:MAG: hypothetical protein ABR907_02745 [Terracidiphilus sp.]|jgi:hypothetical protein
MDGTALVAIYGAIVSTFAVAWNVYRDSHDRARLELSTMVGFMTKGGNQQNIVAHAFALEKWPEQFKNSSPELLLTITNVGRRPVVVQGWAIQTDSKKTGHDKFLYKLTILPKTLKEGEYAVERTGDLSLLVDGAKRTYAWDSAGTKWALPSRQFRSLQREIRGAQAAGTLEIKPFQTI